MFTLLENLGLPKGGRAARPASSSETEDSEHELIGAAPTMGDLAAEAATRAADAAAETERLVLRALQGLNVQQAEKLFLGNRPEGRRVLLDSGVEEACARELLELFQGADRALLMEVFRRTSVHGVMGVLFPHRAAQAQRMVDMVAERLATLRTTAGEQSLEVQRMSALLQSKRTELATLEQGMASRQAELGAKQAELEAKQAELALAESRLAKVEGLATGRALQVAEVERNLVELSARSETAAADLAAVEGRLHELVALVQPLENLKASHEAAVASLEGTRAALEKELDDLRTRAAERKLVADQRLLELAHQTEELHARRDRLAGELQATQAFGPELDRMRRELEEAQASLQSSRGERARVAEEQRSAQARVADAEARLEAANRERQAATARGEQVEEELRVLRGQVESARAERLAANSDVRRLNVALSEARASEARAAELRRSLEAQKEAALRECKLARDECEAVRAQAKRSEGARDRLEAAQVIIRRSEEEAKAAREETAVVQAQAKAYGDRLRAAKEVVQRTEAEAKAAREQAARAQADAEAARASSKATRDEASGEISRLQVLVIEADRTAQEKNRELQAARSELAKVRQQTALTRDDAIAIFRAKLQTAINADAEFCRTLVDACVHTGYSTQLPVAMNNYSAIAPAFRQIAPALTGGDIIRLLVLLDKPCGVLTDTVVRAVQANPTVRMVGGLASAQELLYAHAVHRHGFEPIQQRRERSSELQNAIRVANLHCVTERLRLAFIAELLIEPRAGDYVIMFSVEKLARLLPSASEELKLLLEMNLRGHTPTELLRHVFGRFAALEYRALINVIKTVADARSLRTMINFSLIWLFYPEVVGDNQVIRSSPLGVRGGVAWCCTGDQFKLRMVDGSGKYNEMAVTRLVEEELFGVTWRDAITFTHRDLVGRILNCLHTPLFSGSDHTSVSPDHMGRLAFAVTNSQASVAEAREAVLEYLAAYGRVGSTAGQFWSHDMRMTTALLFPFQSDAGPSYANVNALLRSRPVSREVAIIQRLVTDHFASMADVLRAGDAVFPAAAAPTPAPAAAAPAPAAAAPAPAAAAPAPAAATSATSATLAAAQRALAAAPPTPPAADQAAAETLIRELTASIKANPSRPRHVAACDNPRVIEAALAILANSRGANGWRFSSDGGALVATYPEK